MAEFKTYKAKSHMERGAGQAIFDQGSFRYVEKPW